MGKKLHFAGMLAICIAACGCSDSNSGSGSVLSECTPQEPCLSNLVCVDKNGNQSSTGSCYRAVYDGESCLSSDAWCVGGTCEGGKCRSTGQDNPASKECGAQNPCKLGSQCVGTRCVPETSLGSTCTSESICKEGECRDSKCVLVVGLGQTCDASHLCPLGADCHAGVCMTPVGAGGNCSASVTYCENGDECVEGRCPKSGGTGPVIPGSCDDTDGDGIPDEYDRCDVDTDGDGTVDCMDLDADGDTIPDELERLSAPCEEPADSSMNGIYDFLSLDSDENGIPDSKEGRRDYDAEADAGNSSLVLIDYDNDTVPDYVLIDTDGDTIPDSSDRDNDGDGLYDTVEIYGLAHPFYMEYGEYAPRGADCDGDGHLDDPGTLENPFDCDHDGIPDYLDMDSDGDTVPDVIEYVVDSDDDGLYDIYVLDSDGDGLSDAEESGCNQDQLDLNCRPITSLDNRKYDYRNPDIDGDGLVDGDEVICRFPVVCDGEGEEACDGECIDTLSDPGNCGGCRIVCTKSGVCDNGECSIAGESQVADDGVEHEDTVKLVYSKLNKDTDEDSFGDLAEYNASIGSAYTPEQIICNPKIGVTKKLDCDDCTGIFEFYFELPYVEQYDPEKEENDTLLFVPKVSKLDVIFNLDTTNSMGVEVQNIKDGVNTKIIPGIRDRVEDSAFGVSHFDDFPTRSSLKTKYDYLTGYAIETSAYGRSDGLDKPFELLGQPSKNPTAVSDNVAKLQLHNGADLPESGFESLWQLVMGDDRSYAPVTWHQYGNFSQYFSEGQIPYTTCVKDTDNPNPWGGGCFRESTLPVVIHITDTTSHDGNKCDVYTENSANFKLSACTVSGKSKTYVQPYDPAYVENTHSSDDVYEAYNEKGARIISIYRAVEDDEKGKQLQQLVETSEATNAYVPVCAFKTGENSWKCGVNRCCTTTDTTNGIAPNADNNCVLSYGIKSGTALSDTLVDGVDALVKYATSNVAAVIVGESIEGYSDVDTSCFIKAVEALQDGYIAPPQEPERQCNPVAVPHEFGNIGYNNGYTNFAIGTSSSKQEGSKLNFRVRAENNCVKPTTQTQVFHATINIVDPTTGLNFGSRDVSIVVPGEKQSSTVIY